MSWGDVLSAVGGAAKGYTSEAHFQQEESRLQEAQQLRQIIAVLQAQNRLDVAGANNATRTTIAGANNDTRTAIAGANNDTRREIATAGNTSREYIAGEDVAGRERIADANRDATDARFWGGTVPLGYARDATVQRGQNMSQATAYRGQDVSAGNAALSSQTSQRNADVAAGVTQRGQDMTDVRGREGLRQRSIANIFAPDGGSAPNLPPAPAPLPVAPRVGPQAAPPPAAAPAPAPGAKTAPPAGVAVGSTVKLRDGRSVTITKINDDGTFEYR